MRDIPLNLLRIFEACARLESYTAAANELHVTHSAISQQMRRLEDALGVKLLARRHDRMLMTEAGAALFGRVVPALRELREAVEAVRVDGRKAVVRVTTIPSLAAYWLMPRVAGFQSLHSTSVAIDASTMIKTLSPHTYDLAIRHGRGEWLGCSSEKLFDEHLLVVCSPSYRNGNLPLSLSDLPNHCLLSYQGSREWQQWASQAGCGDLSLNPSTILSDAALMIGAAIVGHGIAIGRSAIVLDHLRKKELVALFGISVRADYSYFLTMPAAVEPALHVRQFVEWLRDEARKTSRDLDALVPASTKF